MPGAGARKSPQALLIDVTYARHGFVSLTCPFSSTSFTQTLKSSTTRSFHMVQSKKKHYDSNDETKRSHKLWNTGLSMSKTSAAYRARAEDLVKRADAKAHPRLATVREQFK